jgi:hypothetical protein
MYYGNSGTCNSFWRLTPAMNGANYWLMGMPMYRAFEINHDLTNLKIGFKSISSSTA